MVDKLASWTSASVHAWDSSVYIRCGRKEIWEDSTLVREDRVERTAGVWIVLPKALSSSYRAA
jgi:hypothetical protein